MKVTTENILNIKIPFQSNFWSGIAKEITLNEVINIIRSNQYKSISLKLRDLVNSGKLDEYNTEKRRLPCVTFAATFNAERKSDDVKSYNNLIVLDFDKLENENLEYLLEQFKYDPYIFAFWHSPSYKGIKGLVALNFTDEISQESIHILHKQAFEDLSYYFKTKYDAELDISGKDITRLCFLSNDSDLIIKDEIDIFLITAIAPENTKIVGPRVPRKIKGETNRNVLYNPTAKNTPQTRYLMRTIILYLKNRDKSITNSFSDWFRVAMAIANTFTFEVGLKYFISLSRMDKNKFSEPDCIRFLENCYIYNNKSINFSTIVYLAKEKGFVLKKRRGGSSEAVLSQVSSSMNGFSSLARGVEKVRRLMSVSFARMLDYVRVQELLSLLRKK